MRIQSLISLPVLFAVASFVGCSDNNSTGNLGTGGTYSSGTGGIAGSGGGLIGVGGGAQGGTANGGVPIGTNGGAPIGTNGGAPIGTNGGAPIGTNGGAPIGTNGGAPIGTGGSDSGAGGSSTTGDRPKGYFYTADWNVSSVDWHGCVWTGIDTVAGTTTNIAPQDFMAVADGGPYQVKGAVNGDYESVALLGFDLNEAITGDANQCQYDPASATAAGPPSVSMTSVIASSQGLAVNWTAATKPGQFRVQLQAPDSATNLAHSWCATITDATGPSFINWTDFYAYCWDYPTPVDDYTAIQYAGEDVDAISFLVPGVTTSTPFDFTVVGFAPGNSAADAPGGVIGCGAQSGTLGNGGPSQDASMQRAAVTDANCKKYVVFNNNWGNPTGSTQTVDYVGNSFTVKTSTGSGSSAPASFPSVYVGASGDLAGGTFNTWSDTGLPKQISAITSAQTTFTWTGNTGDYNSTYDVWFAKSAPAAGSYNDAISGFLMVWLYKPSNYQPIGSVKRTASIAGHTWDVWVGPRGNTSAGTDDSGRPVVSYVAQDGPVKSLSFDLNAFISDAVTNGASDMSAAGTSQAFSSSWYLTDVFAGFEAWSGGSIVGNTATMSIVVQ